MEGAQAPARERMARRKPRGRSAQKPARSTHKMSTRTKAVHFLFFDLPPEIRNHIYSYLCFTGEPLSLANFTLPPQLFLSRQIRSEAASYFFSTNNFTTEVRCNWCIRFGHFHHSEHIHYEETGIIKLSPLIANTGRQLAGININRLPEEVVRFNEVSFQIGCGCCQGFHKIATLTFSIKEKAPIADLKIILSPRDNEAHSILWMMFDEIKLLVKGLGGRDEFNGFTIEDIKKVAMCFRHEH